MKKFEIFKAGKHTSAGGTTLQFSEDDLKRAVEAYDPAVHEAPIVVGHPKDNGPAYGWIAKLDYADGIISAEPVQVEESFAEMVTAGRFKKRSASFYTPDSPSNPKPGAYYLRHVGFLGAQPPAVKGLKDVAFNEAEEGIVEFADGPYVASLMAQIARRMREWLIEDKGVEQADKVVPDYLISSLESEARAPEAAVMPTFTEDNTTMFTKEQYEALQAELNAAKAQAEALQAQVQSFGEREAALTTREEAIKQAEQAATRLAIDARIQKEVDAGRVLPAKKAGLVEYAMGLADAEATINFGEGDTAEKVSQREFFLRQLSELPKAVDYSERSGSQHKADNAGITDVDLANKARAYAKKKADEGVAISFTEAVAAVHEGLAD